jgi:NAD(P)-dependent dehydrogenase (short-subunit alcohol dehydrogenase family)
MKLQGKVAIVTGGGKGIGRATALALADEGASVVVAARTQADVAGVAAEIRARHGDDARRAVAIACDVTDPAQVKAMVDRVVAEYGRIDVLVNNAGYSKQMPFDELTLDEFRTAFEVNTVGTFNCCKAVVPVMRRQKGGKIVNVVSGAGRRGSKRRTAYVTAKFGVMGFSQCLQLETADDGISVIPVLPGPVDTEMRARNNPGEDRAKLMKPEDIAEAIVFAATRAHLVILPDVELQARDYIRI